MKNDKNNNNIRVRGYFDEIVARGILVDMSVFAVSTPAPNPQSKGVALISLVYVGLLVSMIVAQLFTFEDFLVLLNRLQLPIVDVPLDALAPIIVAAEVAALPYLLRMSLSPAFRLLSALCAALVPVLWATIIILQHTVGQTGNSIGLFGDVIAVSDGVESFGFVLLLAVCAGISLIGMPPSLRQLRSLH
jgi:hypothetical protein